jgi:hypothetical protein
MHGPGGSRLLAHRRASPCTMRSTRSHTLSLRASLAKRGISKPWARTRRRRASIACSEETHELECGLDDVHLHDSAPGNGAAERHEQPGAARERIDEVVEHGCGEETHDGAGMAVHPRRRLQERVSGVLCAQVDAGYHPVEDPLPFEARHGVGVGTLSRRGEKVPGRLGMEADRIGAAEVVDHHESCIGQWLDWATFFMRARGEDSWGTGCVGAEQSLGSRATADGVVGAKGGGGGSRRRLRGQPNPRLSRRSAPLDADFRAFPTSSWLPVVAGVLPCSRHVCGTWRAPAGSGWISRRPGRSS